MEYANPLKITVTGLKLWSTNDGGGYQCNLLADGVKFAVVTNDGNGGAMNFEAVSIAGARKLAEMREFVKTLPRDTSSPDLFPEGMEINDEMFVDELVSDAETQKRWKALIARTSKKAVAFTLPEDEPYSLRTVKFKNEASRQNAVKYIMTKYPLATVL